MKILTRVLLLPLTVLWSAGAQAQYTTPNTGLSYTLADLVAVSGGVFTATSDTSYLQSAAFTLAATDTLKITADGTWAVDQAATIGIFGTFIAAPPDHLFITNAAEGANHQGMRFEDNSTVDLRRAHLIGGGGIKCLTPNLSLSHCTIADQAPTAATGGALELSGGKAIIDHVVFSANERAAISSAANQQVAPRITNCSFLFNGYGNTNRPQINLGPSGPDTTFIRKNTVIGDPANTQVGGIAFASLIGGEGHAVIDSNLVVDNRYGITVAGGNITSVISNNILTDNNTQGVAMLGGSGININGSSSNVSMVSGNQISGNLWGVTLQGAVTANFGDTAAATFNPGGNAFSNNANGGVIYALYNNTPNPVPAMNNCWDFVQPLADSASVAEVIFDAADDAALGEVFFMPYSPCAIITGADQAAKPADALTVYPNPSNGQVRITSERLLDHYALYNAGGQLVRSGQWPLGHSLDLGNLGTGLYLLKAAGPEGTYSSKLVVE